MTVEERAAKRGARWLDENRTGWSEKVTLPKLDMSAGSYCVLGQTGGNYWEELDRIRGEIHIADEDKWTVAHGFNAPTNPKTNHAVHGYYERLALAWFPLVTQRQLRAMKRSIKDNA